MDANSQIDALLKQAKNLIDTATTIADQNGVSFYWDGFAYGMGGRYEPKKMTREQALALIERGEAMDVDTRLRVVDVLRDGSSWQSSSETGWISSSSDC